MRRGLVGAAIAALGLAGVAAFVYPRTQRHCAAAFEGWARACAAGDRDPPLDAFDLERIAAAAGRAPESVRRSLTLGCVFETGKTPSVALSIESFTLECRGKQVVCLQLMPSDQRLDADEIGAVCERGRIVRLSAIEEAEVLSAPPCTQCGWP